MEVKKTASLSPFNTWEMSSEKLRCRPISQNEWLTKPNWNLGLLGFPPTCHPHIAQQNYNHKINHKETISTMPLFIQQVLLHYLYMPGTELETWEKAQQFSVFLQQFHLFFSSSSPCFQDYPRPSTLTSPKQTCQWLKIIASNCWFCDEGILKSILGESFWNLPCILNLLNTMG